MTEVPIDRPLGVLVGAGPGEASLISQAGLRWLMRADVVIYDRLVCPSLLSHCREGVELIYVGKGGGEHSVSQDQINQLFVEHCKQGHLVVRLKGGDPLVFGRGGEEADALAGAGIPFRIIPGITAAAAAGAYAGIPLTDRRLASTLALVTGHEDPAKDHTHINWKALAGIDTVVFYMGVASLPLICKKLVDSGRRRDCPVAVIQQATSTNQRTVTGTLDDIAELAHNADIRPPAIIIVGQVVTMRPRLSWYESLPLFGKRILVTRTRQQASTLTEALEELGADVIEAPTVEIHPPEDPREVDDALGRLNEFDWLVLTSPNGVDALFARLVAMGADARSLAGVKIAAVGTGTSGALAQRSIHADLVPETFTTAALADALIKAIGGAHKKVLLARSDIATPGLAEALTNAGADLREIKIYRTTRPAGLGDEATAALKEGRIDWVTFTSSSTAENFLQIVAPMYLDLQTLHIAAIGPVTAETLKNHGLAPHVTASPHTIESLVKAMVNYVGAQKRREAL
jgi:uroporphyrinogen III methyltransferase/synthase